MRIAHVTATFPPYWAGTGNVAYHNARLLQERGYEVVVFTAKTPDDNDLAFPFRVERLHTVLRIGNAPLTPTLVNKLQGFDLIHLHYPYIFGTESSLIAARLYNTPLVLTYHNQLHEKHLLKRALFYLYNHTVEPIALRATAKVLAVSEEHLIDLHPHLLKQGCLDELPNGVDLSVFKPSNQASARRALGLPPHVPIALFVGALDQAHRFKNVDGLLRAFTRPSLSAARLVVVGDGDLRSSLEAIAIELGISTRVHFFGKHAPASLPRFYNAADVTVLPSTGVESFGIVLIESMACATPVVASNLPGVRMLVEDGVDGRRTPPGDLNTLGSVLEDLFADRKAMRRMGLMGREKVTALYSWEVIGDKLERCYADVLTK